MPDVRLCGFFSHTNSAYIHNIIVHFTYTLKYFFWTKGENTFFVGSVLFYFFSPQGGKERERIESQMLVYDMV